MRIAKVSGDNIQIRDHTFFFPNTSFSKQGPDEKFIQQHGYVRVIDSLPFDATTQKLVQITPRLGAGVVECVEVQSLSSDELQAREDSKAVTARQSRDQLLKDSDWTMVTDSALSETMKAWYTAYRQELRDLPDAEGWPTSMTWPTHPSANTGG